MNVLRYEMGCVHEMKRLWTANQVGLHIHIQTWIYYTMLVGCSLLLSILIQKYGFWISLTDHHVFFVNGSSSCSGTVWVEQMGQTYALSGQLNVWNDRAAEHVCQKMQCGHMANFRSTNRTTNVTKQLDCQLSKDDCKLQPATSLTTETAEVNCTGNP